MKNETLKIKGHRFLGISGVPFLLIFYVKTVF